MDIKLTQEQVYEIQARPVHCHRCREMIYGGDEHTVIAQPFASVDSKPEVNGRMEVYFYCAPCTEVVVQALEAAGLPKRSEGDLRIGHRIEDGDG